MHKGTKSATRPKVVIVGGGFGGLQAARALKRAPIDLLLIDRTNHHTFQPLLYQVATAGLSPGDIAAPLRSVLREQANTEVIMAEVTGIDTEARRVLLRDGDAPYDLLVLATGSRHSYFGHPEWETFAPGLKYLTDATAIRYTILKAFEAAEIEPDPERRRKLLTFVLVGAGPTGVEMAGAISELAHTALPGDYRHIDPRSAHVLLLEAGPRILPTVHAGLAERVRAQLTRMGAEVRTNAKVEAVDIEGVTAGESRIEAGTIIWTAGVAASPAGRWLNAETDSAGRVKVQPDLTLPGHPEIFVIGDAMTRIQDGRPLPGLAPVAMQQGRYVARTIRRRVACAAAPPPFRYVDKGNLATVGRKFAILEAGKIRMSGVVAWIGWLVVHIFYLIGFRNRLMVVVQWAWAYFTYQRGVRVLSPEIDQIEAVSIETRRALQDAQTDLRALAAIKGGAEVPTIAEESGRPHGLGRDDEPGRRQSSARGADPSRPQSLETEHTRRPGA
jgi:NADH dehydrogenase